MDLLLSMLFVGLAGGFLFALAIARTRQRASSTVVPKRLAAPSPSLINMAHIPVDGVGGLGMVAAVTVIAILDPQLRLATMIAVVLGAGLALYWIAVRRGKTYGSGDDTEDRSTLHLDNGRRPTSAGNSRTTTGRLLVVTGFHSHF